MNTIRTGGIVLSIGSLLFLVAAFMPVSRVFVLRSAEQQLAVIAADRSGWQVSQFLFGSGATIAWVGMAMLAYRLKKKNRSAFPLLAVAASGAGLVFWIVYLYLRTISPENFVHDLYPGWLFPAYSFLTLLAIFVLGMQMYRLKFPPWLSLFTMISALLLALAFLLLKDLPPLLYYMVTLVDGIAVLVLPSDSEIKQPNLKEAE
jgi:hypothetical protein